MRYTLDVSAFSRRDFLKKAAFASLGFLLPYWMAGRRGFAMNADKLTLAFGDSPLVIDTPQGLTSLIVPHACDAIKDQASAVLEALAHPVGSPPLADRIKPNAKIAVVIADRTRLFPQKMMMQQLLGYLQGQGHVDPKNITFIVGNGNHAVDPLESLALGEDLLRDYRFVNFDSTRYGDMERLGHTDPGDPKFFQQAGGRAWTRGLAHVGGSLLASLKSLAQLDGTAFGRSLHGGPLLETGLAWVASRGTDVWVEQSVADADLVIGIGQIKPHPLTGYSGGVKAIVPGVSGRRSTVANHLLQVHPSVGLGKVDENILRLDLEKACNFLPNVFILNVVMNGQKQPAAFVAGDPVLAHRAGVAIADKICRVEVPRADIVIYSNRAQGRMNLYQFIKSLAVAKDIVKPGGVIIAVADLPDGVGSRMKINPSFAVNEVYYHYNYSYRMPPGVDVYLVSPRGDEVARGTFFIPVPTVEKAVALAKSKVGPHATICAIPDTDMVIPQENPGQLSGQRPTLTNIVI